MEAAIDAIEGFGDDGRVRDIALDQGRGGRQIAALTGGQVIEHTHGVAPRDQSVAQVRADEAGSPGDQIDTHEAKSGVRLKYLAENGAVGQAVEALVDLVKGDGPRS